jgi:hypothetical protein
MSDPGCGDGRHKRACGVFPADGAAAPDGLRSISSTRPADNSSRILRNRTYRDETKSS